MSQGRDVMTDVNAVLERMTRFTDEVRDGRWRGWSGEPVTDVVNIGIGGSDLGPRFVCDALAPYAGAIHASILGFSKSGKHQKYDLGECVHAIRAVGFTNTLAIEFVGKEDPFKAIERARDALQAAIDVEQPEEVEE